MKKKAKKDDNYRKLTIPKAIREQCWIETMGRNFESKCYIPWCKNIINVFDFHVGHDIPESEGGTLDINNIKPMLLVLFCSAFPKTSSGC